MSYWYVRDLKAGIQDGIVNRFVGFIDCNVFLKYSVQNCLIESWKYFLWLFNKSFNLFSEV